MTLLRLGSIARTVAVLLAGCALAACDSGGREGYAVTPGTDVNTTNPAADMPPPRPADDTASHLVNVELVDYAIRMPERLPAGPTTFRTANSGSVEHGFEIEGEAIERKLDTPLKPGVTGSLAVTLEPGTYRIYCPVADHAERGMSMSLTVGS